MVDEYKQVAAILALDIDTFVKASERNPEMAQDFLKELKTRKDKIIEDSNHRNMRYEAMSIIFNLGVYHEESSL